MAAEQLWTVVRFPNGSWSYGGKPDSPDYEHCEIWQIMAATAKDAVKKAQAKRNRDIRKRTAAPTSEIASDSNTFGQVLAGKLFSSRGKRVELHISQPDLATVLDVAYEEGAAGAAAVLRDLVAHLEQGVYAGEKFPPEHPMIAARAFLAKADGGHSRGH